MGVLFGTDGVRGIVNDNLNIDIATKIGVAASRVLKKESDALTFVVGSDTRISKDVLKMALCAGVLSEGANIIDVGVLPTPAVSYLIRKYNASGGFVISASHNPSEYNGIKIFNSEGFKLEDSIENDIEDVMLNNFSLSKEVNKVGRYEYRDDAINDYVDFLISTLDCDFEGLNIAVDAANGAAYKSCELLFTKLKANFSIINNNPDGININKDAGSTHVEGLSKYVVENNFDCGIAYDGDADRLIMVDNEGTIVDGDKVLAIYSKYLKDNNMLTNNTLVGTVMSNLGLVKYCERENINFESTKVGDRYVLESMLKNNYILGGEQSGHIIFKDYFNTGDGELSSIQILKVMKKENKSLKELASIMDKYPQVLKNVNVSKEKKDNYKTNEVILNKVKEVEEKLNGEGRVLVRASGTENLIRVMLEGKNIEEITLLCDEIVNVINEELN